MRFLLFTRALAFVRNVRVLAYKNDQLPTCYIRIDVAHFIKEYSNFFFKYTAKNQFYLSLLGQLILCHHIETAKEILISILMIVKSEAEGNTRENKITMFEEHKKKMKRLLTSANAEIQFTEIEDSNSADDNEDHMNDVANKWFQ
jgi:hypothetical protein